MTLALLRCVRDQCFPEIENDFRHSGQGIVRTTAWVVDGLTLTRMLDLVDHADEGFQLCLCRECGISGCEPAGWVRLRRFGKHLLLVPAFGLIAEDDGATPNHRPPNYLTRPSIPAFGRVQYGAAAAIARGWPGFELIPTISSAEAMALGQLQCPDLFGSLEDCALALDRDRFLATSEDDLEAALDLLEGLIDGLDRPGGTRLVEKPDRVVEYYIDDAELSTWAGVAFDAEGSGLYLAAPEP